MYRHILTVRQDSPSLAVTTLVSALLDSGSMDSSPSMRHGPSTYPTCHTRCRVLRQWSSLFRRPLTVPPRPITPRQVFRFRLAAATKFRGTTARTSLATALSHAKSRVTVRRRSISHSPAAPATANRCNASVGSAPTLTRALLVVEICVPQVRASRTRPA